jgi:hypothetical protein
MKNWIIRNNQAVNLNQVTDVQFTPATSGFDEEEQCDYTDQAKLLLVMTSTESELDTNYDGDVRGGICSVSRQMKFTGKDAEVVWEQLRDLVGVEGNLEPQTYTPHARSMSELVTPRQLVAIRAISNAQRVDSENECEVFFKERIKPEELSRKAASAFIDYLKSDRSEAAIIAIHKPLDYQQAS